MARQTVDFDAENDRLFADYFERRDPKTRDRIIIFNYRLAYFCANCFRGNGEPIEDLRQEALVELMRTVDSYQSGSDAKFSTYAIACMIGHLKHHFRDKAWNIRPPRWMVELKRTIEDYAEIVYELTGCHLTAIELADEFELEIEIVIELLALDQHYRSLSLDEIIFDNEHGITVLGDRLYEEFDFSERIIDRDDLISALKKLSKREKAIIYYYYFLEQSDPEIGRFFKISDGRINLIRNRAISKLKEILEREKCHS